MARRRSDVGPRDPDEQDLDPPGLPPAHRRRAGSKAWAAAARWTSTDCSPAPRSTCRHASRCGDAVAQADAAFRASTLTPHERGAILDRAATLLEQRSAELVRALQIEVGFPASDGLGELQPLRADLPPLGRGSAQLSRRDGAAGRRAPPGRPHRLHAARAAGRGVRDHALQCAAEHRGAQGGAGAGRGQCRGAQAVQPHAHRRRHHGRGLAGRGAAARDDERHPRRRRDCRLAARRAPRALLRLHRQHRGRCRHPAPRRPAAHADGAGLDRLHHRSPTTPTSAVRCPRSSTPPTARPARSARRSSCCSCSAASMPTCSSD